MTNTFTTSLDCSPLPDGVRWRLNAPLDYVDPQGQTIRAPAGFTTDFATIPNLSFLAGLLLGVCFLVGDLCPASFNVVFPLGVFAWVIVLIAEQFLHEGTWDCPAALHDYLYATRCRTYWQSNWILFKAMGTRSCSSGLTPMWKRVLIYGAVTVGGWWAWHDDARRQNRVKPLAPAPK